MKTNARKIHTHAHLNQYIDVKIKHTRYVSLFLCHINTHTHTHTHTHIYIWFTLPSILMETCPNSSVKDVNRCITGTSDLFIVMKVCVEPARLSACADNRRMVYQCVTDSPEKQILNSYSPRMFTVWRLESSVYPTILSPLGKEEIDSCLSHWHLHKKYSKYCANVHPILPAFWVSHLGEFRIYEFRQNLGVAMFLIYKPNTEKLQT